MLWSLVDIKHKLKYQLSLNCEKESEDYYGPVNQAWFQNQFDKFIDINDLPNITCSDDHNITDQTTSINM